MINVAYDNSDPKKPKTKIDVDNGDREALNDAISKWKFKDEASMLRFAIAVLREAKDKSVIVTGQNGLPVTFAPAEKLLNTADSEGDDGKRTDKSESESEL